MRLTNQLGTFFTNEKQVWDFHWPRGMRAFLLGSLAGQWVDTGVRVHLALVSRGILNQSKNGKKTETIKLENLRAACGPGTFMGSCFLGVRN